MPREKEGFREQLQRLTEMYPGREMISLPEACKVTGCYRRTLLQDKTFPRKKMGNIYKIPLVALARWMC